MYTKNAVATHLQTAEYFLRIVGTFVDAVLLILRMLQTHLNALVRRS